MVPYMDGFASKFNIHGSRAYNRGILEITQVCTAIIGSQRLLFGSED